MKPFVLTFACAATLTAQNFIQMSDPQFGMFTKDASFEHETVNFEFAIATANRLKPALVVITGDLINKGGNPSQAAEYKRISAKLDPKIRLFSVPGSSAIRAYSSYCSPSQSCLLLRYSSSIGRRQKKEIS